MDNDNDNEVYSLTPQAQKYLATIMARAEQLGLVKTAQITAANSVQVCSKLAQHDEIWDDENNDMPGQTRDEIVDCRKVLLAFALSALIEANKQLN